MLAGNAVITYKRIRMAGHIAAALATASFIRGLVVQKGDVSPIKTFPFGILLVAWFIVMPLIPVLSPMMPRTAFSEVRDRINKFMGEIVFPPIIIAAFLWLTFTSWQRTGSERPLSEILHEMGHGQK